jgi:anthranilate synthase component 1
MNSYPPSLNFDKKIYIDAIKKGQSPVLWTECLADLETPVSVYLKLTHRQPHNWNFLLESVEGGETQGRYSFIGTNPDLIWTCRDNQAFINRNPIAQPDNFVKETQKPFDSLTAIREQSLFAVPEGLPPHVATLIGYIGYDMIRLVEKLPSQKKEPHDTPDSILMRPSLIVIMDNVKNQLSLIAPLYADRITHNPSLSPEQLYDSALDTLSQALHRLAQVVPIARQSIEPSVLQNFLSNASPNMSQDQYKKMVVDAKQFIKDGDIFQVVLSQRFDHPFPLPAFDLYRSLRRINPSPFLFHLQLGDTAVIGSSPEILVRLRHNTMTIRPIAGTRKRGANTHEDLELARDLLDDPKERAEHLMLLDLGRNDVGRMALPGSVRVTESMIIEYYSHVMHIISNVEGKVPEDTNPLHALMAGFPAGTVSGAPKIRAMEIIDLLEHDKRGVYGGCIGYFGADNSMDTCIALRTAVLKNNILSIQAGAGIVADSIPENEYLECVNKAKAMVSAAEDALKRATSPT